MTSTPIRLILDNLRGTGNVGSILRTADACGVDQIVACGYTPYPRLLDDARPPHVADANHRAIAKTALGAETTCTIRHAAETVSAIHEAHASGFMIIIIEQAEDSLKLEQYQPPAVPLALVLGNEVDGVNPVLQALADAVVELPMIGRKESLNVAVAAAVALYHFRFGI